MRRYDAEYNDARMVATSKGRFYLVTDVVALITALRIIAGGKASDAQALAEGVLHDLNIREKI